MLPFLRIKFLIWIKLSGSLALESSGTEKLIGMILCSTNIFPHAPVHFDSELNEPTPIKGELKKN